MRKRFLTLVTLFASFALLFGIWGAPIQITDAKEKDDTKIVGKESPSAFKPVVNRSLRNNTSIPLREMKNIKKARVRTPHPPFLLPKSRAAGSPQGGDAALSKAPVGGGIPSPFVNFEGGSDDDNETVAGRVVPPDTNGDVGPNHYVQYINLHYNIYDKSGNKLLGPVAGNAFWTGLGGPCEDQNDGDPVVLYDHLADRWFASQFALFAADGGHHQCIAISQTGDPLGSWHQYDFLYHPDKVNDYPKFGVWPDAYYMTANQFTEGFAWAGAGVMAFERDQMLNGNPAQQIYFDLFGVNQSFGGMLPSDLDGPVPPAGAPNIYAEVDDESVFGDDQLSLWEFHVDWVTPANATFGIGGNPNLVIPTADFDWNMCGFARNCIPQPAPGEGLDAISDRLLFRLQYRNFGAYSTLVTNHTVDADGTDHAGVRWYELRDSGSGWTINQQGTWAPDSDNRWMGSAAMDSAGNIAVGYSVSSSSTNPAVRYAGRLSSDPPGDLSQGEASIIEGTGVQVGSANRWGDYSGIVVDPSPGSNGGIDCDFWVTNEYYQNTGNFEFNTHVGAFTFAPGACGGPTGVLNGTVTDSSTGDPIAGAQVQVQPGGFTTTTNSSGFYQFTLAVGTYDVTASAYGYFSETVSGIVLDEGETETVDFALDPAPSVTVQGIVYDNSGHGWPLYARIDISGYPGGPIFTNPSTGTYDVELVQDTTYIFNVTAISDGYNPESRSVTPPAGGSQEDFGLTIDTSSCSAPGYGIVGGLFEQFEDGTTPPGWTVINNALDDVIWVFNDPANRGNLTGGSGGFAIVDSDFFGCCGDPEDTEMHTPVLDFTGVSSVFLEFDSDFNWYDFSGDEKGDVDVSIDGGTTWVNVFRYQGGDFRGPRHESVDISATAGNQASVTVRFHFYDADFEFWWQVDNVKVGAQCLPIPGGLMVGNVNDGNTDEGLNGATVASVEVPTETTTTFSTPLDPKVDEGFYILFSSLTGLHEFTASKTNYGSDTHSVNVVEDSVIVQNYSLGAGILVVDPLLLEATVDLGTTQTLQLTITNNGTAPADFELVEGNGLTNAPTNGVGQGQGTPVKRIKGDFSPLRPGLDRNSKTKDKSKLEQKGKEGRTGGNGPVSKTTPNDPPWTDIADYPASIMDNTAAEIEGLIYSVGGFDGGSILNSGNVYDPVSDSWSSIASMTGEREKPAVAAIDGLLYVTGGWDGTGIPSPTLEIYDPSSDSWSTGASIPTAYAASTGVNLDGLFYVIGGCDSGTCGFTDVQVYDPSADSWSSAADYPEPISWLACGAIGGQIYCAGGVASGESQNTYVYDPGTDSWSPLAALPQTQWAMGFVASDDLLYISGGVTDNFATVTNEGFVYDPAADTWTSIANSNNTVYRGASACGFYKIGGSIGGFSPIPSSEVLPGLTNCGGAADVPWLSENPVSGTVQPGQSVIVDVTFDAGQVDQPGDYFAHLTVKENTPYAVPDVQVIMHVPLPATWGTLEGTVDGLGRCDAPGGPLAGATVFVDGPIEDFTLETDANGFYQRSFDAANSPVTITVSANGYVGQSVSGVVITAQQTTVQDFTLRLDAPCADKSPASFDVTLNIGETTTEQLTLTNSGAGALTFTINETTFQLPPLRPSPLGGARAGIGKVIPAAAIRGNSVRTGNARGKNNMAPVTPNAWFFGNDVPGGVTRYAHAQCDLDTNSFYVISGVDSNFSVTANAWRFDATTNTWNALAPIPSESEGPTAVCYQGKIYVMGGSGTNAHFIYDIASDTWSTGALLPRGTAGSAAGAWAGKVYLIGGDDDFFPASGVSDEVNVYDVATDTWLANATSKPIATSFPGYVQAGPYVYVVGGWGVSAPGANVAALQQYDMSTDTWTGGPDLASPRADLALSMTDTALYASGGDGDGAGFFDGVNTVERYEWANFPGGAWADAGDPLPTALQGNNAGFCTEAIAAGSEIWSVGAIFPQLSGISGLAAFRPSATEKCFSIFSDVPWLSESPTSGTVPPDSSFIVDVTFDATGLTVGDYFATLVITTNDAGAPQFNIPVALHVVADCDSVITLSPATLPNPVLNQPYDQTITASGGVAPYEFDLASGTLPDGLTLNISGQISGTPTVEGTFTFTIEATDSEGCSGSQEYTVTVGTTSNLYFDDFGDQTLPPWTFTRTWIEDPSGFLTTTSNNKATAIATDFSPGCVNCTLTTAFKSAASSGFKVWIYFHYVDNGNKIEILFKDNNKVVAKEWVNGVLMEKTNAPFTVNPNQLYQVALSYDGTEYELVIDGTSVLTFTPSGAVTGGTFGVGSKDTPIFVDFVQVN